MIVVRKEVLSLNISSFWLSGYFLGDLYQALEKVGCSITLTTNHRSEADLIVSNACAIAEQRHPIIDPARNFHQISIKQGLDGDMSCGKSLVEYLLIKPDRDFDIVKSVVNPVTIMWLIVIADKS